MRKANAVYNLTTTTITVYSYCGKNQYHSRPIKFLPVEGCEPGDYKEGTYYIVGDFGKYVGREDVVQAVYAGRDIMGTMLYKLRDVKGEEVVFGDTIKNYRSL